MRGLFVTAVLIAVGVVAADRPCLTFQSQFTYDDGLTVALKYPWAVGYRQEGDKYRWAIDLNFKSPNLFRIFKEGLSTTCRPSTILKPLPYPRCVPDDAKLIGNNWVFKNDKDEYVFYNNYNPSMVMGRSDKEQGGTFHNVSKWSGKTLDKELVYIPNFCKFP